MKKVWSTIRKLLFTRNKNQSIYYYCFMFGLVSSIFCRPYGRAIQRGEIPDVVDVTMLQTGVFFLSICIITALVTFIRNKILKRKKKNNKK